ncbi:MAG: hypothetical protein M0Z79_05760 [Nitrospiraceae bacterium]|nr:hypothetical protein [Nitrospiraceae bacterium]
MKTLAALLILTLIPVSASSHPGKTDVRGGHKCWKDCEAWRLRSGEYHLHDRYLMPIRIDRGGRFQPPLMSDLPDPQPATQPFYTTVARQADEVRTPEAFAERTPAVPAAPLPPAAPVNTDVFPLLPLLLALVAAALGILLIVVRRRRG